MADSEGKMVMEKYQLRIVNSTKDLLLPARVAQLKSALLVGNPSFDLTATQQRTAIAELRGSATGVGVSLQRAATPAENAAQMASRGGELKGGNLNSLPGTQVEVDTVDKLLKSVGWRTSEFSGRLALKETVTQAHGPRVVHIATHGFFLTDDELTANAAAQGQEAKLNEDPMLRAGLFFAGADRVRQGAAPEQGVDDGVLTAFEASQLNLEGTELVVLSACETGLGKELNGEGVFGLRRGLQEAGADAVMMSMWSVPDKETQELMALFYAEWLGGLEKPEALRQAQAVQAGVVLVVPGVVTEDVSYKAAYALARRSLEELLPVAAPNWHYLHIHNDVIPALKQRGVTDEQLHTMLVDNPRRIFERQDAY